VLDADGACVWCNHTWCALTGTSRADAFGTGWLAALTAEDRAQIALVTCRPGPFELELVIEGPDGAPRRMLARAAPQFARDGTFTGHVISATDVTQWREHTRLLQFLAALGDVLMTSLDVEETLCNVAELVVPDLADLCVIAVAGDDSRMRRLAITQHGDFVDERFVALGSVVDPEGGSAIAHVVRTEDTLYRPIVDAPGPDEPWPVPPVLEQDCRTRSLICVPLRARSGVVGALALVSWQRRYTPDDVELAKEIAYRCAFAVDSAVLYRRSEDDRANLALISHIGEELATTLDLDEAVERVVRGLVPTLADEAEVWLAHDDELQIRARHPRRPRVPARDASASIARAFGSRNPIVADELLCVPLMGVDEVHGVLALTYTTPGRCYTAGDLPLALDIARRATFGIERARAFDQERRVAEALQRSMLPDELPDVEGVSFCARYLPGGEIDVGGDWYDVVALGGCRFGVVIGDVAGHGVRAATVMGQLRHALRAFASEGYAPADVVARLNRFAFEQGPVDMATLCYGVLDVAAATLEYASAGHLPLLLAYPDHALEFTAGPHAPPIGVDPDSQYEATTLKLEPGTTVVFYTDGLVERRGESLDRGLDRLADEVRYAALELDQLCDGLLTNLLETDRPRDDVAVLGVRFLGARAPIHLRRPARATELAPMRRHLSAWLEAAGVPTSEIPDVAVAVTEAATNAIEHAYVHGPGWFEVVAEVSGEVLTVRVRDMGQWRPKVRGTGGRGLDLIARLMDRFEVRRDNGGTEVWMQHDLVGDRESV
jgi:GAF domain-containing protein/anti-sigma regulatory factor (Ser/Thr protein kinase)